MRQTMGLSNALFAQLASFGSFGGDSSKFSREAVLDSVRHTFALRRDSLAGPHGVIGRSGISSITVHDTTIDSTTYFSVETTVASLDSLSGAAHLMSNTTQVLRPDAPTDDSDDIRIVVKRMKEKTTLMFLTREKEGGFMNIDMPGIADLFANLGLHYRVFSAALERPTDKHIKQIPGGQERVFGIKDLTKKGKHSHLDASFVIRNVSALHK